VTVRGNNRQTVFHTDWDRIRFLKQLADALEKNRVILYAYVLMPNHFHLFVETPYGNLSRFMQRLNTAYSMYHRYKHSSPGHCFQGRYGAKLVEGDEYIARLTRYIHLNPIKVECCDRLDESQKLRKLWRYKWSSLDGYVDTGRINPIVDYRWLQLMGRRTEGGCRDVYKRYMQAYVKNNDEDFRNLMEESSYAIGDECFVEQVHRELSRGRERDRGYGDVIWPTAESVPVEHIAKVVATAFDIPFAALSSQGHAVRLARKFALELACRHSGQSQRKIGESFGYRGNGAVGKQRQRLRDILAQDGNKAALFHTIEGKISNK
jgi:putative transposase